MRKKKLLLTPEEAVRQKLIYYLINEKNIASGLISIERMIKINNMQKRFDIVIFDTNGKPYIAIECKAPEIKLTQKTMQQLAIYNLYLNAKFLMITNGYEHLISEINFETREINFLNQFPI